MAAREQDKMEIVKDASLKESVPENSAIRKKVTVLIAAHKPYRMPEDPMYLPLFVGAALRPEDFDSFGPGFRRDDEGENISRMNPGYSELTGLYWGWKNLDSEYLGLVHYRRHFRAASGGSKKDPFTRILSFREIEPLLSSVRVFVPKKRHYYIETLYSHYAHTHDAAHLDLTREILGEKYPGWTAVYDTVVKQRSAYMFNMMIMERALLSGYLDWLFDILFELQNRTEGVELSAYQGRFYGRVSEILFNVWLQKMLEDGVLGKREIRELPLLSTQKVRYLKKGTAFLRAKFLGKKYEGSF